MVNLLAMSTGSTKAHGPGTMHVIVQEIVDGAPKFLLVSRAFVKIDDLEDGSESAWPVAVFQSSRPDENGKAWLFAVAQLLSGRDSLPAMPCLLFETIRVVTLKSVGTDGVFE